MIRTVLALLVISRVAIAAPPTGYQCGAGKPIAGTGCACPANYAAGRDGEDTAICIFKGVPAPKKLAPPRSAKEAFDRAELALKDLDKLPPFRGTIKDLAAQFKALETAVAAVGDLYIGVVNFKDPSFTLSAVVRRGDSFYWMANRVLTTPVPKQLAHDDEVIAVFQEQLDKLANSWRERAITSWKEALNQAKGSRIWNAELAHAQKQLSNELPDEFPSKHDLRYPTSTTTDPADAGRWNDVAVKFLADQQFADGKDAAEKSLSKAPNFAKAQVNLATALRGLDKWDEAQAAYEKAITTDPRLADAYYNLVALHLDVVTKETSAKVARAEKARATLATLRTLNAKLADELARDVEKASKRAARLHEREQKKATP